MRLGVTSSKKIGNAPQRNRARRVIRAAFRELDVSVNRGVDIIFVARGRTISVKSTALVPVMRDHLKRLGIIGANGGAAQ